MRAKILSSILSMLLNSGEEKAAALKDENFRFIVPGNNGCRDKRRR